ncbi:hypothetical protein COS81_00215 [candidate division WWE3 bacterium CG06_land_8_20_14_3_00_42_16]|uniref:Uncharacterized protein n=2 Tax=Katanobacteria TaxID=422282 RepID=A0A2M7APQ6_UNCKA|nr:MAG: hypothetical protein AUJ38_00365 [bacterium CG1_02_42_9]PIU69345.1 MAG: hypothetical protein COS81_00215 [candidate division WWE3 bacterium CG06_land_8_20_14_3_00_42_16]PIZ43228.1 MAG: hypothetical protein COY34_01290 [candidate division WWE3 bacterium CG_4_10_14_0_2_um_filter_42_8]
MVKFTLKDCRAYFIIPRFSIILGLGHPESASWRRGIPSGFLIPQGIPPAESAGRNDNENWLFMK